MDIQSLRAGFTKGGNIIALAENGRTWLAELGRTYGYVTREPHKRTLL